MVDRFDQKNSILRTSTYEFVSILRLKYLLYIKLISLVAALAILVAPHFNDGWRFIIESNYFTSIVLDWYSSGRSWAYISLAAGLPVALYSQSQKITGNVSKYCYPFDLQEVEFGWIVAERRYPCTPKEEVMFWLHRYFDLYIATVWIFWMAGLFNYVMI